MAKQKRWKYYIGVYLSDGSLHYVTDLDNVAHRAIWEANKPAKEFSMHTAEDICEGLNMNMIHSILVKAPSYMTISNGEETE